MAVTYTKTLKTINITLHGVDTPVEVADTADAPVASRALAEFEAFKTMHVPTQTGMTLIPFHAVISIAVTSAQSDDITRPDICDSSDNRD